jgi:hypothetical protein
VNHPSSPTGLVGSHGTVDEHVGHR